MIRFLLIVLVASPLSAEALPKAQTKKTEFVFNNAKEPETLDPHRATGVYANMILIQSFEGLMAREANWADLRPGQAERYTVSSDKKTYRFYLRENLRWSDGSPLTAKDFRYSWLRSMHPQTLNGLRRWFTDHIVGAAAYAKEPTEANAQKVGIRVIEPRVLEVELRHPLAYFLQLTALAPFFPVKKDIVEAHPDQWFRPKHVVSNGPYKLNSWKVNKEIQLQKNPHYYAKDQLAIKRIRALAIKDRKNAVYLFNQGKLDWTGLNGAPNGLVPQYKNQKNFRTSPASVAYFYRFNTTKKPFNDKRVRQALSLAIDRDKIVQQITRGGEEAATYFVPEVIPDYTSPQTILSEDFESRRDRAKKLLAQAGYPQGKNFPEVSIYYNTDENNKRVALAIQNMWKRNIGVNAKLFNQEWKVHLQSQSSLSYDISRNGWAGYYPDPFAFLEIFKSSSAMNQTGWKSKAYDALLDKANRLPAGKKRKEVLQRAEALLIEEAPMTPIYSYVNFGFLRPEVKGFPKNPVDRPFVRYLSKKLP